MRKGYIRLLIYLLLSVSSIIYADIGTAESSLTFLTSLPPGPPALKSPEDTMTDIPDTTTLYWNSSPHIASYTLQVSDSPEFADYVVNISGIPDTSFSPTTLENDMKYYWRVNGSNTAGDGEFSDAWTFTTTITLIDQPTLYSPENHAEIFSTTADLIWHSNERAESYHLQVSTYPDFLQLIVDQEGLTDTFYAVNDLSNNTQYFWRVCGANAFGEGSFSDTWSFTITDAVAVQLSGSQIPRKYSLLPVYPNPFNPETTITYTLPERSEVSLVIINNLGQSVQILVSGVRQPGFYLVRWNGRDNQNVAVSSGVYLCRLQASGHVFTQKMIFIP